MTTYTFKHDPDACHLEEESHRWATTRTTPWSGFAQLTNSVSPASASTTGDLTGWHPQGPSALGEETFVFFGEEQVEFVT